MTAFQTRDTATMSATNEQFQALQPLHKQVKYPDRSFFSFDDPQVVNVSTNFDLPPLSWATISYNRLPVLSSSQLASVLILPKT
jgi:hypothetical protein